jgi:hypothetical protein
MKTKRGNMTTVCAISALLSILWSVTLFGQDSKIPQPPTAEKSQKPSYIRLYLGKSIGGGLSRIEGPMLFTQTHPYEGKPEVIVEQIATIPSGYTFRATAFDANDLALEVNIYWRSSNPKVISITPTTGNEVIVRGLKEGTADIDIKAESLTKTLKAIKVTSESNFKQ